MRVHVSELKPMMGMVHTSQLQPYEQTQPERPATMAVQVDQLSQGLRRAVYFPKGTPLMKRPKGLQSLETPEGVFFYNPAAIDSKAILKAQGAGSLNEVLGASEGGMGPTSKSDALNSGNPVAVVGRTPNGTVTQGTLATPETAEQAIRQTAKVTPRGTVALESPAKTVRDRQK